MGNLLRVTPPRCQGCGKCELACAFAHGAAGRMAAPRIRVISDAPERGVPVTCLQCDEAACVVACGTGALARNELTGAVELSQERCVGCRACVAACPFGNVVWDEEMGCAAKCDLCGGAPRCVSFCPSGALRYGGPRANGGGR